MVSFSESVPLHQYMVRCGDWDLKTEQEPRRYQDRLITKASIHPSYNHRNLHNDFAILHLDFEFELDDQIGTVCLPDDDGSIGSSYFSDGCLATGWGKENYGEILIS